MELSTPFCNVAFLQGIASTSFDHRKWSIGVLSFYDGEFFVRQGVSLWLISDDTPSRLT